ncbi:MAG: T9SS type A sorting domain-containing protein [Saprospiraceae bacterium]
MKSFLLSILIALVGAPLFSQAPVIAWQNTVGGSGWEQLYCIQPTSDGGYILGGHSYSNISGDKTENSMGSVDYWVVKLDASGNVQWENTIGGNDDDVLYSVQQTADGGYILGGESRSDASGDKTENSMNFDYWVVKLNAAGSIQWQNTIGGSGADYLYSVQQTADGGYILGGSSFSNASGDKTENNVGGSDYWIVKIDAVGNIQWQNTIGGSLYEGLSSIRQTSDGGYIIGGTSNSNISGDKTENSVGGYDYWVVKLYADGGIQWQNTIGGHIEDSLQSAHQASDGGYIIAGHSFSNASGDKTENNMGSGETDYWVVKLNATGNIQWQNTIGGEDSDDLYSAWPTPDGGCTIGGASRSGISGDKTENSIGGSSDCWVMKLDAMGNIQWQNTIGGSALDGAQALLPTADGGYIIGGWSQSGISGDKTEANIGSYDFWAIKLTQPMTVPFSFVVTKPTCPGSTNGKIVPKPAPGSGSTFTYLWSTGATTKSLSNITAGTYTVTITQSGGKKSKYTVQVQDPFPMQVAFSITNPSCAGNDGSIKAIVSGGTGSKTFLWSNGQTTPTVTGLTPGDYSVTVTDSKGCTKMAFTTLSEHPPAQINILSIVPDGSNRWKVTAEGFGVNPVRFRRTKLDGTWTSWQFSPAFPKISAGNYTFQVRDSDNCIADTLVAVPGTARPVGERSDNSLSADARVFPNPVSAGRLWIDLSGTTAQTAEIQMISATGAVVRAVAPLEIAGQDAWSMDVSGLPAGLYFLEIKGDDGTGFTEKVVITK